jgi:hypothetical protein
VVTCLATFASPLPARAEPKPADQEEEAHAFFLRGQFLLREGKDDDACVAFRRSLALVRATGTLLHVARCNENAGLVATAYREYTEVADRAEASGQAERAKFARDRAEGLGNALPRLRLEAASAAPDLRLTIDGVPVEVDRANGTPVDPGARLLELWAGDRLLLRERRDVPKGPGDVVLRVDPNAPGNAQRPAVAGLEPLPPAPPSATPSEWHAPGPSRARVHIEGNVPGLTLHVRTDAPLRSLGPPPTYRQVCAMPCNAVAPLGAHRLGLSLHGRVVAVDKPVIIDGDAVLRAHYRSYKGHRTAGVGVLAGAAILSLTFVVARSAERRDAETTAAGVALTTLVGALVSLPLLFKQDRADVFVTGSSNVPRGEQRPAQQLW